MMDIKEANKELKWIRKVIEESEMDRGWDRGFRDALVDVLGEDIEE